MPVADIPGADFALVLGGALTTAGSICAILALLDRSGKEIISAIAVCFLGLGAVLLLWPVAYERGVGIRIYWGAMILVMFVAVALAASRSRRPPGPDDVVPVPAHVEENRHLDDGEDSGGSPEDRPG